MPCISKSSKSCLDANSRSSSFYLVVITCMLGSFISSAVAFTTPVMPTNHNSSAESCASVKDFFIAHGISEKDVPERPIKGEQCSNLTSRHELTACELSV